jgi:hypothetical protein
VQRSAHQERPARVGWRLTRNAIEQRQRGNLKRVDPLAHRCVKALGGYGAVASNLQGFEPLFLRRTRYSPKRIDSLSSTQRSGLISAGPRRER